MPPRTEGEEERDSQTEDCQAEFRMAFTAAIRAERTTDASGRIAESAIIACETLCVASGVTPEPTVTIASI